VGGVGLGLGVGLGAEQAASHSALEGYVPKALRTHL
jgi:hypothetical protein